MIRITPQATDTSKVTNQHRGLVVLGMQLPGSFQRHGSPVRRELTGVQAHHQDENDLRIQDMEASLTVMLQEIQPVWWHLKGIKTEVADKESRLGAAYESSARLEGLSQQREANLTGGLPVQISEGVLQDGPFSDDQIVDMRKRWQAEQDESYAYLAKAKEWVSDSTWRQKEAQEDYVHMKDKYWTLRDAADARRYALQDSAKLLADQPADVKDMLADLAQRGSRPQAPSDESYLETEAGQAVLSGGHEFYEDGWWGRGERGPLVLPSRPESRDLGSAGSLVTAVTDIQGVDETVRCRMSGICEGPQACPPKLQDNASAAEKAVREEERLGCITDNVQRQDIVREAALSSWKAYRQHAFGQDEFHPQSETGSEWFGLGLTIIDSLDTLMIMGLSKEVAACRAWIAGDLKMDQDSEVNLFETTIRVLGGLLTAYHLSNGDQLYLIKALELGLRLAPGFKSPSGIPWSDVNLGTHGTAAPKWNPASSTSEVTTLAMEYGYLARLTGRMELEDWSLGVMQQVADLRPPDGLVPIMISPESGTFTSHIISLGARGDSYYEYLLKTWVLLGKPPDHFLIREYKGAMRGIRDKLLARTSPKEGLLYVAELHGRRAEPKMDHLVCFFPGLVALGHLHGIETGQAGELPEIELAEALMQTCYEMYRRVPAGLSPEIVFFEHHEDGDAYPKQHIADVGGGDFHVKPADAHYLLRPETMESLFYLWRITGKQKYREWAWHIFRALHRWCPVRNGAYTSLNSILQVPPPQRDKMESFWLAELLKYLYLILDTSNPPRYPLDEYVFNTEAHPLPIAGIKAGASGHFSGLSLSGAAKGPLKSDMTNLAAMLEALELQTRHLVSAKAAA